MIEPYNLIIILFGYLFIYLFIYSFTYLFNNPKLYDDALSHCSYLDQTFLSTPHTHFTKSRMEAGTLPKKLIWVSEDAPVTEDRR